MYMLCEKENNLSVCNMCKINFLAAELFVTAMIDFFI